MRINNPVVPNPFLNKENASPIIKIGKTYNMDFIKFENNSALFKFKGHNIHAKLENNLNNQLKPGQNVQVRVESFVNNQLVLKLYVPEAQAVSYYNSTDIKKLLMANGLNTNKVNMSLVETMLKHKIPITAENIKVIQNAISHSNLDTNISIQAAIFLMERNLPMDESVLDIISAYFQQKRLMGKNIATLSDDLQALLSGEDESELSRIEKDLREYILTSQNPNNTKLEKNLSDKIQNIIRNYEDIPDDKARIYENIRNILASNNINLNKDIKEFMEHIFIQGIINKQNHNNLSYLYFQFPFEVKDKSATVEIFLINKDSTKNIAENTRNRMVFSFHTEELGQVKVDILNENKNLNIGIGLESTQKLSYVQKKSGILKDLIEPFNYNLNNFHCFIDTNTSFEYVESQLSMPHKIDRRV